MVNYIKINYIKLYKKIYKLYKKQKIFIYK